MPTIPIITEKFLSAMQVVKYIALLLQFCLNRKLYVAFIGFEKAFNSINRSILWPILIKNGIRGKLYKCITSMYDCVKARV